MKKSNNVTNKKAKAAVSTALVPRTSQLYKQPSSSAGVGPDAYLSRARTQRAASTIANYARMLAQPFHREYATRYPDETITPTALSHFAGSLTWDFTGAAGTAFIVKQEICDSQACKPIDFSIPSPAITPLTISNISYGSQLGSYARVAVSQRTLAYGVRARVTGLPSNTFLPSGTVYFLQLQEREMRLPPALNPFDTFANIMTQGEQAAIAAVLAGKGFSVTVNELSRCEGLHIPYIPSGPQNMDFDDYGSLNSQWAGNGAIWSSALTGLVPPVTSAPSFIRTAGTDLVVFVFGAQAGVQMRFDFAHHVEYIPGVGAAGLVQCKCADADVAARQGVHQAAQALSKEINGSTSLNQVQSAVAPMLQNKTVLGGKGGSLPAWLQSALDFARPHMGDLISRVASGETVRSAIKGVTGAAF